MDSLILGKWGLLDPQELELFTRTGLIHLFSASGFHMACAISMAKSFDKVLLRWKIYHPLISLFTVFFFGLFFGFSTNWSSPMVRALAFTILLHIADFFEIKSSTYWVYSVSIGISYLLGNSSEISLYLSSFGMAGILLFRKNTFLLFLSPWLFTAPLIAIYFQQFSLTSPFYNFFFSYIIATTIMPLGIIGLFERCLLGRSLYFFPAGEYIFQLITQWLFRLERYFSFFYYISAEKFFLLFSLSLVSYFSLYLLTKKKMISLVWSLFVLLSLCIFFRFNTKSIHIYNVGQGDSILLTTLENETVLFDLGPPGYKRWPPKIYRELKNTSLFSLDHLVITHLDRDHYGDLAFFLSHFFIRKYAWVSVNTLQDSRVLQILDILYQWNVPVKLIDMANAPPSSQCFLVTVKSRNSESPACLVTLKNKKTIWMMGDLDQEAEKELLRSYSISSSDYIKIGHHGSKYSSSLDWLEAIHANQAFISVGKNSYGHPHQDVLDRLQKQNYTIYRTDKSGSIQIP